jgi:hypothetical protein
MANDGFVMLPHAVFDCPAYGALSAAERTVMWHLVRLHNGRNNGRISLAVRDAAAACHLSKDTAMRAFRSLIAKGFIEATYAGSYSAKHRASEWRLNWLDSHDKPASWLFLRWLDDGVFDVPALAA